MSGGAAGHARLDFAIVGAQRAGSTQLSTLVQAHPDVALCPDEVPFFEDPFFANSDPDALDPVFARAHPSQRHGIHCPSYLGHPETAGRIAAYAPDARILTVLRDPVPRAVSLYFWYVQFGMLPLAPLDEGMARLLDGWSSPDYPHAHEVIEWGMYGRHLRVFYDSFPAEQVHLLLLDELGDPATIADVYGFLGVDRAFVPPRSGGPVNAGVYDMRRLRWLRLRHRFAWQWSETERYEYLPRRSRKPVRFVANAAIVGLDRMVLARIWPPRVPRLDPDLERQLRARYTDDVVAVEAMLGRPLPAWR